MSVGEVSRALYCFLLAVGDHTVVPESDAEPSPASVGEVSRAVTETICYVTDDANDSSIYVATAKAKQQVSASAATQLYVPDSDAETGALKFRN